MEPADKDARMHEIALRGSGGVRLGAAAGRPVWWSPGALHNDHVVVTGPSGSGKTSVVKTWIARRLGLGDPVNVHVIDVHGEYAELGGVLPSGSSGLLVPVGRVGLPFRLLEGDDALPRDIAVENALADLWAASPGLGPVQIATVRALFAEGLAEAWSNHQLRQHLEAVGDPHLQAHLMPIALLLRSEGVPLETICEPPLVLHDLSCFDDHRSRAAYAICLLSRLMQHRQVARRADGGGGPHALHVVFEEAHLLIRARDRLERFFRESRKLGCGGVFVAHTRRSVPAQVEANSATAIALERGAEEPGRGVLRAGGREIPFRADLFHEQSLGSRPAPTVVLPMPRSPRRAVITAPASPRFTRRLWLPPSAIAARSEPAERAWFPALLHAAHEGSFLFDLSGHLPICALAPLRFLECWPEVVAHLEPLTHLSTLSGRSQAGRRMIATGLVEEGEGALRRAPALDGPPLVKLPSLRDTPVRGWPTPPLPGLDAERYRHLKAVLRALWKLELPAAGPTLLMLPAVVGAGGEARAAWSATRRWPWQLEGLARVDAWSRIVVAPPEPAER